MKVIPWEELESRIGPKQDPNLTPTHARCLSGQDIETSSIASGIKLSRLNKEKEVIEAYGGGLAKAEQRLVTAAVAVVFGDLERNTQEMQEARKAYLAAFGSLENSLGQSNKIITDLTIFKDYHSFLEKPEVAPSMTTAFQEFMNNTRIITVDNADMVVLRNFAMAVSRSLSPDEFFQAYEVNLDLLGWESEKVVENVRMVMELSRSDARSK